MQEKESSLTPPDLSQTKEHGMQIVSIKGKLTYGTTQEAKVRLKNLFDNSADGYIIDMADVEYIDSTGFGLLINFAKQIASIDRKMALIVTNDFIYDLFKISKFHLVFPVVKTKEEGFKVLKEQIDLPLPLRDY
ncbi:STAS domain-containing protein [Desulfuribacillus alkaliarsenatis]|uniref:Anti-sigma factor antagonist n=1 Tax=Desulfuribacillus alkaliarsenatis TaxID=766136 RepID=A0A1E5G0A5_9FIRM|nr:STAS domain-containing protein [Desulfuribacillus alkaliarsenatis]OEF96261.1 hypothetical protein BHF68_08855 [Desulfuribacillus alkaliarsenatis]